MPDVPMKPRPEPEPTLAERAEPVVSATRVLLTGDPNGRVRRPLLYAVASFGTVVAIYLDGPVGLILGGIAIVALMLLAWTDNLV